MSAWTWLVLLGLFAAFGIWEVIKARGGKRVSEGEGQGRRGERNGKPPYPAARIIELPGGAMRIIDLRSLPAADLAVAKLGIVQAQLLLERPVAVQIWVAPVEVMRGWAALDDVALVVLNGRFRDPRDCREENYLYPYGGTLSEAEGDRLRLARVEVVRSLSNLSDPPKSIEDFLGRAEPWTESSDDRPVPAHDVLSADPLDGKPIRIIEGIAFVDLRRLHPDGWKIGVALEHIERLFPMLVRDGNVGHAVWVVAPWVLERIDSAGVTRIAKLVDMFPTRVEQRLAVIAAAGEQVGSHPLLEQLSDKLRSVGERFLWRTKDRGEFDVHPIEALHDAYFVEAWKLARL